MSTSLDASTVTPGRTAPEESYTTPVMDACAHAETGTSTNKVSAKNNFLTTCMLSPLMSGTRWLLRWEASQGILESW